jgi:hypothetical protein
MAANIQHERLTALARLEALDIVRREIVEEGCPIGACQFDLSSIMKVDDTSTGRQGGIFGGEISGHG